MRAEASRWRVSTKNAPGESSMNETMNKTTKPTGSAKTDAMQTLRETTETSSAQAKQGIEKMTATDRIISGVGCMAESSA